MKEDLKNGLEFYFYMNQLKSIIRRGALLWKVDRPRFESDAEHIALTETLAIVLANQLDLTKKLNMGYLLQMLNFHEIGELKIGDLTLYDNISATEKHKQELEYAKTLLGKLKNNQQFVDMLDDFNNGRSFEAKFAKACDKLENCLEFKKYSDLGQTDLSRGTNEMLNFPRVKELLESGVDTFGELLYQYHLPSFAWLGFEKEDWQNLLKKLNIKDICE